MSQFNLGHRRAAVRIMIYLCRFAIHWLIRFGCQKLRYFR
jgi:hypothetical protein